jgi:hypothetical protein
MYYSVQYSSGLFSGGIAYIKAATKKAAQAQCKRNRSVDCRLNTLTQISKAAYDKAAGKR